MFLLSIVPVLKFVYLCSEVEEKNDTFLYNIHPGPFDPYADSYGKEDSISPSTLMFAATKG